MMRIENLSYHYRGGPDILRDVSFCVEPGQLLAILGNNGVGKSTLLKCFNHILRPKTGQVLLDEQDILSMSARQVARKVAFVGQNVPAVQMTVHDVVMLGRRPYMRWGFTDADHAIVHEAMDRLGLDHLRGRFLSELSGGERQKVMLARALAQQAQVLLLDEPTSALDIQNQYHVLHLVRQICREDGRMAIMVIHDLNLALRFCDAFVLMKDGRVFRQGDWRILDGEALQAAYGVCAVPVQLGDRHLVLVD